MAEQTVREEMAAALEGMVASWGRSGIRADILNGARSALARHRAEPEGHCVCNDHDCPTWEAGFLVGSEAQRERVGGGRA